MKVLGKRYTNNAQGRRKATRAEGLRAEVARVKVRSH